MFVGRWENTKRTQAYWKLVVRRDQVVEHWVRTNTAARAATVEIRKTWVDAEGGTCCWFLATDECYGRLSGMRP